MILYESAFNLFFECFFYLQIVFLIIKVFCLQQTWQSLPWMCKALEKERKGGGIILHMQYILKFNTWCKRQVNTKIYGEIYLP